MEINLEYIVKQMEILKNPLCPLSWASEKYGIPLRRTDRLNGRFRKWALRFGKRKDVMTPTQIDRFEFELFLQFFKLVPIKFAAIQLGMSEKSFGEVVRLMQGNDELSYHMDLDDSNVIDGGVVENLVRFFPGLEKNVYGSQPDFCKALHQEIRNEYDLDVDPVFCETSELIDESPEYAYEYDALTSKPVSIKYQLWMDLGKPISLKPDACSILTYHACREKGLEIDLLGNYEDRIIPFAERMKSKSEAKKEWNVQP